MGLDQFFPLRRQKIVFVFATWPVLLQHDRELLVDRNLGCLLVRQKPPLRCPLATTLNQTRRVIRFEFCRSTT